MDLLSKMDQERTQLLVRPADATLDPERAYATSLLALPMTETALSTDTLFVCRGRTRSLYPAWRDSAPPRSPRGCRRPPSKVAMTPLKSSAQSSRCVRLGHLRRLSQCGQGASVA